MKDGFIKVAAATPAIRVADPAYNATKTIEIIKQAEAETVKLLVLPELALTGYTCGDLFLQETLLEEAEHALQTLLQQTRTMDIITILGLPVRCHGKLYSAAAVFSKGEILGIIPKSHIPNYGEFYEARHFTAAPADNTEISYAGQSHIPFGSKLIFAHEALKDFTFAVEICEDLWVSTPISARHAENGAMIIANCSASDETIGKAAYRRQLVQGRSAASLCGYIYADAGDGESTTDMVFAGHNLIAENGTLLQETSLFRNGMIISEMDVKKLAAERLRMTTWQPQEVAGYRFIPFTCAVEETTLTRKVDPMPFVPADAEKRAERCESILNMQAAGLRKRIQHTGAKTLVLGISGGLDSCLALLVSVRAMDLTGRDRKDIHAITMPCFGTTTRTRTNAEILAEKLGVGFRTIDISEAVKAHFHDIDHDPAVTDVTFENAQARERTQVLMDYANQLGGLVVGTGDLSELALGWATYNGDHMSMYGVNAGVPKTLIRHLVRFEADRTDDAALSRVLLDILDTPVSPELLPAKENEIEQKTEDIVGPYELHDFFLYYMIRYGASPEKTYRLACYAFANVYPARTVQHWLKVFIRRFFQQQFKRSALPDGPKVGSVSLSPRGDWRMPSDASAEAFLKRLESIT